jgi:two-component system response regulator LytT
MNIAICDDEQKDAEILVKYFQLMLPNSDIIVFHAAKDLLNAFTTKYIDLIFLDIEMAPPNGYEIGKQLSQFTPKPLIIFTTNSLQHAVLGYGIAFRYLTKPISFDVFQQTFQEALPFLISKKISLSYNGTKKIISVNEIIYFESLAHHVIFHLSTGSTYEIKSSISQEIAKLPGTIFLQVHKSFCININFVDKYNTSTVTMTDGTEIPISRNNQKIFAEHLMKSLRKRG